MGPSIARSVPGLLMALLLTLPAPLAAGEAAEKPQPPPSKDANEETVFELKEIQVLEADDRSDLLRGQSAYCKAEPAAQVKKYPKLNSKHPWYGEVVFGRQADKPGSGTTFYFVIDESGEQPASKSSEEAQSWLNKLADVLSGKPGVEKKEEAKPITYDRLYFDLNHDLDLTNDAVLQPQRNPPANALPPWSTQQKIAFPEMAIALDGGPGCGVQSVRVMPRVAVGESRGKAFATVLFLALTARRGTVRIGSREYEATLGQPYAISGRFDLPHTYLRLKPLEGSQEREHWWGGESLSAMRAVGDELYTTRATPRGDKFFVKPYRGDFGTFKIGPGNRKLEGMGVSGALRSREAAVPIGNTSGATGRASKVQEYRVPVGDYVTTYLSIEYGHLSVSISENYHSDGLPRSVETKQWVYGVKIRKDQPFVLDFSNKPEVLFASPAKDKTFHPGDEVEVKAVLIDPVLDIMIRRLSTSSRKEKKTYGEGANQQSIEQPASLDPIVTITDSAGKTVSEGPMPFG